MARGWRVGHDVLRAVRSLHEEDIVCSAVAMRPTGDPCEGVVRASVTPPENQRACPSRITTELCGLPRRFNVECNIARPTRQHDTRSATTSTSSSFRPSITHDSRTLVERALPAEAHTAGRRARQDHLVPHRPRPAGWPNVTRCRFWDCAGRKSGPGVGRTRAGSHPGNGLVGNRHPYPSSSYCPSRCRSGVRLTASANPYPPVRVRVSDDQP